MIKHETYEKALKLNSKCGINAGNLKEMLSDLKDTESLEVILCTKNYKSEINSSIDQLKRYCKHLYDLLNSSLPCVERSKEKELKSGYNTIYYEKNGFNQGATGLYEDIKKELENFSKKMIQLDLEIG